MVCILRHGPIGHREIIPKIGGTGIAKPPFPGFFPVLWLPAGFIGGDHPFANLDRIEMEGIGPGTGGKPDILHAVFPVGLGSFSRCHVMRLRR